MNEAYKKEIHDLFEHIPFDIDLDVQVSGKPPSQASSEFLTNKEQGDWAERVVLSAINEYSNEYVAIHYGRDDNLAAGDPGFADFYRAYQDELNNIGKKPDLLIFRKADFGNPGEIDLNNPNIVSSAIAALEVRSSSFLVNRYNSYMDERTQIAERICFEVREKILAEPYASLLNSKNPEIFALIKEAKPTTFRELDFRLPNWSSTSELKELSNFLRDLKDQIKILHKRDYLSITPKLEDLSLVNRWIQNFAVPHYYLQVFFDKAYVISFKNILKICCDSRKEGEVFSIEQDVKNQGKTTIKINIQVGKEILGRIDMPKHKSELKELERGRLLFYVTFNGGKGYLDLNVFNAEIINND